MRSVRYALRQDRAMRGLAVFLFCLGLAAAAQVKSETRTADKEFLTRQKNIFHLLYHVHQPNIHQDQVQTGKEYSIESNMDKYDDVQVVKQFLIKYKARLLPKGRIFSVLYTQHMYEADALFKVFFHAKDFDTFYNTACWAREHVNEQMFVYALSIAVLHRPDCHGFVLPPPYEIHPYYFLSTEVIQQAYQVKMQGHADDVSPFVHSAEGNTVIISSNYTGWYVDYNEEQKLSYFTEDVGLNAFYYYNHLECPFWMPTSDNHEKLHKRGEMFYFLHRQLLARYYLERLSNGLDEIPQISWRWPVETGFLPSLQYHNGMELPSRPNHFDLHQDDFLHHLNQVQAYDIRISEAIDQGYLVHKNGTHIDIHDPRCIEELASIIESNADTPNMQLYRYPLTVSKMLLGNSVRPMNWHKVAPSALENYQTFLRDPVSYQLLKHYNQFFFQYKSLHHAYTKEELICPGVKIENVEVEKLVTYFDHFDVDITNVVFQGKDEATKMEDELLIKARQYRLNHKPFTVTTNVVSEKATKVIMRTFLGPKFNGKGNVIPLNENRVNFVELDEFVYELKSGKNTIQRNSRDFIWTVNDATPSRQVYKDINEAIAGTKPFAVSSEDEHSGFPDRLILPKGRKGGMPFYVYVIITPYHAPANPTHLVYDVLDDMPYGFPFDRPLEESTFITNNMHFEDVLIFHKKESDINQAAHQD